MYKESTIEVFKPVVDMIGSYLYGGTIDPLPIDDPLDYFQPFSAQTTAVLNSGYEYVEKASPEELTTFHHEIESTVTQLREWLEMLDGETIARTSRPLESFTEHDQEIWQCLVSELQRLTWVSEKIQSYIVGEEQNGYQN